MLPQMSPEGIVLSEINQAHSRTNATYHPTYMSYLEQSDSQRQKQNGAARAGTGVF